MLIVIVKYKLNNICYFVKYLFDISKKIFYSLL